MNTENMTKMDAEALEALCEKKVLQKLKAESPVEVSMALSGRLKISIGENSYNFIFPGVRLDWFSHKGDYDDFVRVTTEIDAVINENIELFALLFWSYKNKEKLK